MEQLIYSRIDKIEKNITMTIVITAPTTNERMSLNIKSTRNDASDDKQLL